jgi:crotonobetainyl-CoA:carnitine CoA-transferase CaiB-like acyl-CoA transferase
MMAAIGILAALYQRERTGLGQHIDLAMRDVQLSLSSYLGTMALLGPTPGQLGNAHSLHVPYDTYRVVDGWIVIAMIFDRAWPAFCAAVDLPQLNTPELASNTGRRDARAHIDGLLRPQLEAERQAFWLGRLEDARIPCAPVLDLTQAFEQPSAADRDMVVTLRDDTGVEARVPGNALKMSAHVDTWTWPPALDGDARGLLAEWATDGGGASEP